MPLERLVCVLLEGTLALFVAWLLLTRTRVLLFAAPLEQRPFVAAFRDAFRADDRARAQRIAHAGQPAWVAQLVCLWVEHDPQTASAEADVLIRDCQFEATRGLRALRVCASVGTSVGLMGAVLELRAAFAQSAHRGRPFGTADLHMGIESAVALMAGGAAIAMVALTGLFVLRGAARRLVGDLRRTALDLSVAPTERRSKVA